jgi:hypothetical protein
LIASQLPFKMARGNQSGLFMGLSALFYLVLLFTPLAFLQTASASSEQEPLAAESYGTGKLFHATFSFWRDTNAHV